VFTELEAAGELQNHCVPQKLCACECVWSWSSSWSWSPAWARH